ncbi:heparinase II/III domain-containing protein [Actinomadura sediminis]|uniref:Heparinase II/III family protein n=1 Tax=Actinomadura sediminis TaxID=1038904 RepID=A0ABW3EU16_9ACTN
MMIRYPRAATVAATTALLVAASGCRDAAPRGAVPPAEAGAPRAGEGVCLGYNGLDRLNPLAEVAAGRFRTVGREPVRVASGTDVDWSLDPHGDRTWLLWFHSLEWLGGAIEEHERTGDAAALDLAAGIVRDWLADNGDPERFGTDRREAIAEGTKFRLATLVCLRGHRAAPWLDAAIARHATWLADPEHYSGPWNHGTDESMILLTAACSIGRDDLADLAAGRLLDSVFDPPGGVRPAIDAQGADNEQSTHYTVYNRSRWRKAMTVMRACGRAVPGELARRHALMDEFIAFQTTPAGDLVQIGESQAGRAEDTGASDDGPLTYVATRGKKGTPPDARARVYEAGYVMGRSGWGNGDRAYEDEMAYTARFGPGRYAHGHNDHMALTFFAHGRDILVPSGHVGYNDRAWREWLHSPRAHNTFVVEGAGFDPAAETRLTGHRFRDGADTFAFSDTSFDGTTRTRSVLAASGPDALAVLDEARSASSRDITQYWHLPSAFAAKADGTGATAVAGGVRVHFLRIPLPGAAAPGAAGVVRGRLSPPQGWIFPGPGKRVAAPTVEFRAGGPRARILTLIAPVRGDAAPHVRAIPLPGGAVRVDAVLDGRRLTFTAAADGALRRGR